MILDEDIVAVSPSSVCRVLVEAGVMRKWERKPSKKRTGFIQPLKPHEHWHISEIEIIMERAKERFPEERPRIISDNGSQFISNGFKEYIRISEMFKEEIILGKNIKGRIIKKGQIIGKNKIKMYCFNEETMKDL